MRSRSFPLAFRAGHFVTQSHTEFHSHWDEFQPFPQPQTSRPTTLLLALAAVITLEPLWFLQKGSCSQDLCTCGCYIWRTYTPESSMPHPSSTSSPERPSLAVLCTSASPVPLYTHTLLSCPSPSLHPTLSRCIGWLLPASFPGQQRLSLLSSLLCPQLWNRAWHIGAEPVKWMTRWSQLVVVHLH